MHASTLPRRYGKVKVSMAIIDKNPEIISDVVFKGCIILSANYDFISGVIDYLVFSYDFEQLDDWHAAPDYEAEIITTCLSEELEKYEFSRKWVRVSSHVGSHSKLEKTILGKD